MMDSIMTRSAVLSGKWEYECGLVLCGAWECWKRTGEQKYFDYIKKNMDCFVSDDGTIATYKPDEYNIDHLNNGKVLILLYESTREDKYRKALSLLRAQVEKHPRTKEGGLWHKKIYPYQMWLDGAYMGYPFIAAYGKVFGEPLLIDDAVKQTELLARVTRDGSAGLYYHGYDESRKERWADPKTGCSPNFWGRSMGWFSMALVDLLDHLPEEHPGRSTVKGILESVVRAVTRVRDEATGLWFQILDKPDAKGNYLEASASCMFVYSVLKAVRMGYVSRVHRDPALRSFDGIIEFFVVEEDDGSISLDRICKVAGLGNVPYRDGSFGYYVSEPIVKNDYKGTGAFIHASLEAEAARGSL